MVGGGGRNSSVAAELVVIRGYSSVVSRVAGTLVSHCGDASNTSRGRESERVWEYIGVRQLVCLIVGRVARRQSCRGIVERMRREVRCEAKLNTVKVKVQGTST
jgi:hypothetical protein